MQDKFICIAPFSNKFILYKVTTLQKDIKKETQDAYK